jgi:seryl-tRNA synthetase
MLDIKFVVAHPDVIKKDLEKRFKKDKIWMVDELLEDHTSWRHLKNEGDQLRSKRNELSLQVNKLKKEKKDVSKVLAEIKNIPDRIKKNEEELALLEQKINEKLTQLPNLTHESVPIGKDETANKVVRKNGTITKSKFSLKSHVDVIQELDLADMERGAKVSGARFYYLKNELAALDFAIMQFAMDRLRKKGYILVRTPDLLTKEAIKGAAELQDFEETLYNDQKEDLFLIATAEHAMAAYHMNETLEKLPLKYVAISECFRREAGAHGKDTKGIFRVHEFRKVEQFVLCHPNDSWKLHEELIKNAEELYKELEIPYRIINIASGELNNAAAKKYDLEAWMPAQDAYREMVSCSNCLDYQARKLNIRYHLKGERGFVHLLNATAIATPRILVAILENFQQKDGSIKIPTVLQKYTGFKEIKSKK